MEKNFKKSAIKMKITWTSTTTKMVVLLILINIIAEFHGSNGTPLTRTMENSAGDGETSSSTSNVSLSITTKTVAECDVGLIHEGVHVNLEYRQVDGGDGDDDGTPLLPAPWIPIGQITDSYFNSTFTYINRTSNGPLIQFRLIQWEHNGGNCNCWGIASGSWTVQTERGHHMTVEPL